MLQDFQEKLKKNIFIIWNNIIMYSTTQQYCRTKLSPYHKMKKTARTEPKNFSFVRFIAITIKNMQKLSNRIGCNDSPYSIRKSTNGKYDWKIFWRAFLVTFVALDKSNPPEALKNIWKFLHHTDISFKKRDDFE